MDDKEKNIGLQFLGLYIVGVFAVSGLLLLLR